MRALGTIMVPRAFVRLPGGGRTADTSAPLEYLFGCASRRQVPRQGPRGHS
jgi:hypothetical protein